MIHSAQSAIPGATHASRSAPRAFVPSAALCFGCTHGHAHVSNERSLISANTTPPSNQGLASLKNVLTGRAVCTVSLAIRQPLGPGFFARGLVFPPVRRGFAKPDLAEPDLAEPDLAEPDLADGRRLTAALTPAFALSLFRPGAALTAGFTVDSVAKDLVTELALDALAADFVAPDRPAVLAPPFVAGLRARPPCRADAPVFEAPSFAEVLAFFVAVFLAPGSAATPSRANGQRALRRCAALRAAVVRGPAGRRRCGGPS